MSERRAAHHAAYQTKRTGRAGPCAPGTAQTAQNAPAALCAAAGAGDARQPGFEPVGSDAGGAEGTVKLRGDQRTGLYPVK